MGNRDARHVVTVHRSYIDETNRMIRACKKHESRLSESELAFVNALIGRDPRELNAKQYDRLCDLFERVVW